MSDMQAPTASDWLVWQLADSALPTGGFAHSGGLETAWRAGLVRSPEDLTLVLRQQVQATAVLLGPFTAHACRSPEQFADLDARCDALLSNHVANRASRSQGQALVATAGRVFSNDALSTFLARRNRSTEPQHWAPALGAVAGRLGLDDRRCVGLLLFTSLRGMTSAAVRLGIIGPLQAQATQASLLPDGERLVDQVLDMSLDDAAQTAPILDLVQGAHDRLYSRLFVS